jgi:hypothetical protein
MLTQLNFVKITEVAQIIGLLFSWVKVDYSFSHKMDWATFWATFSKKSSGHPGRGCESGFGCH